VILASFCQRDRDWKRSKKLSNNLARDLTRDANIAQEFSMSRWQKKFRVTQRYFSRPKVSFGDSSKNLKIDFYLKK